MKKLLVIALIAAMAASLGACSSNDSSNGSSSQAVSEAASEGDTTEVTTDYGTVQLGQYKGLDVEKTVTPVTDEDIDYEVECLLEENSTTEEEDVAENGDEIIDVTMTVTVDGTVDEDYSSSDGYTIYLGDQEFGKKFDKKLLGCKVGDKLSFSIKYKKDDDSTEFAGSTVDYDITVNSITREIVPDLTEDLIKNTLGYDSEEDMRESIKADLEASNDADSTSEMNENLYQMVINNSTFSDIDDSLVSESVEELKSGYEEDAQMWGYDSVDDYFSDFGYTEDDLKEEAMYNIDKAIVVLAISELENISVTDEEYQTYLTQYTENYGYDSESDLEDEIGEDSLNYWFLDDEVAAFLADNANITEVEASDDEADSTIEVE